MQKEKTLEQAVEEAIKDVHEAMIENIKASRLEMDAQTRKKKAYYTLLKAKERLRSVEQEMMTGIIIP